MLDQIVAFCAAVVVFLLLLWIPGTVLAYGVNAFSFRSRPIHFRVALGLIFSMAFAPIVVYLVTRTGGLRATTALYALVWLAAGSLIATHSRQFAGAAKQALSCRGMWALIFGW